MVNYLTTPDAVRRYLGLTSDDVEDSDIKLYIESSQKELLRDLAYSTIDDVSVSTIGTTITFSQPYIADRNFDNTISTDDIKVFGWTDKDDPISKVSLTVTNIYSNYGKVVVSASIAGYQKVTADYYYYPQPVYLDEVPDACAVLTAFNYALSEMILAPKQWMHGSYRFLKTDNIADLELLYWKRIASLRGKMHEKGENSDIEYNRVSESDLL